MRYRKLDKNYDYTFGNGRGNFWINVPDGPAQAVLTRLMMWQGEWFLDLMDGMNWKTGVLGKYTNATRDFLVRARVIQTKGVSLIADYSSSVERETRDYVAHVTINTDYSDGVIAVMAKMKTEPL